MLGKGTDEELIKRNSKRLSREGVNEARKTYKDRYKSDLFADAGVYGQGSYGELSGDERVDAQVDFFGVPQNDKERAEVARYRQMLQRSETGAGGKYMMENSVEEWALSSSEARLNRAIGGKIELDEFGRPIIQSDNFDASGKYIGRDREAFDLEVNFAQTAAESYQASLDRMTNFITTAIAIIGAVIATVVTGGAGAPLLAMAIAGAAGLTAMGVNYAMKGGRYGWEQALTDLGMVGVQVITAGVGQKLGAVAKAGTAAAEAAETGGVVALQTAGRAAAANVPKFTQILKVGAATGFIGTAGSTALNEKTWENGFASGMGKVFMGGAKGAFTGTLTAAISGGLERIPFGGSTVGNYLQNLTVKDKGIIRGGLTMLGAGTTRAVLSTTAGVAGRAGELGFEAATGTYHGSFQDALNSIQESGAQTALQSFFEGAGQTAYKPPHPIPEPSLRREQHARAAGTEPDALPPPHLPADDPQRLLLPPAPEPQLPPAAAGLPTEGAPGAPRPTEEGLLPRAPGGPVEPPAGGGGGGGGRRPGGGPPPEGPEPLLPGVTDPEMDALFTAPRAGPRIQAAR